MFRVAPSAFARWLNDQMEKLGLTQEALGNKVDVSHVTVSKWQRGKHLPDPKVLRKLAAVTGVEDIWLFRLVGYLGNAKGTEANKSFDPEIENLVDKIMSLPESDRSDIEALLDAKLKRIRVEKRKGDGQ
jgi:transcriptional regulator with XRE-family HTH domain